MQQTNSSSASLERRVDLTVAAAEVAREVGARLGKLQRTTRLPGFRPGKVPMKMVVASYGAQVESEVLNDKVGAAFSAAVSANGWRVAGPPRVEPRADADAGALVFSATFEVYPEVQVPDLSGARIERAVCAVGDTEVESTLQIMRKQRARFEPAQRAARDGDGVAVDFAGTIDGTPFDGGSGTDVRFVLGEGRMLPEFEAAVRGMESGESKTFALTFPADYRAAQLAGKTAQFTVTVKAVDEPHLPEVDAAFARQLGVADGDLERMRAEIRANLEREVGSRLRQRTRDSVMNALLGLAGFDLPRALLSAEQERLVEQARGELRSRGVAANDMPVTADMFAQAAERRVRLGLLLAELVQREKLQAQQQQIRKAVEDIAQSYEKPAEVIQWYLGSRERLGEIESGVVEQNVIEWALGRAAVVDTPVAFDELMGHRD